MAKKNSGFIGTFGGNPKTRMSNVLSGDRTGRGKPARVTGTVQNVGVLQNPRYGAPVTRMGAYATRKDQPRVSNKDQSRVTPGLSAGYRNKQTSLAGGLGMQAYGNPAKGLNTRTPRDASLETRNYQYGNVMGAPAKAKTVAPSPAKAAVVSTTTDMKSSPAPAKSAFKGNWTGAAPTAMQARAGKKDSLTPVQRQARMMAEQQVGSRKTSGGQSASAGFKSLGDMGRRAAGALGFGGAKSSAKKSGGGRNLSGKP